MFGCCPCCQGISAGPKAQTFEKGYRYNMMIQYRVVTSSVRASPMTGAEPLPPKKPIFKWSYYILHTHPKKAEMLPDPDEMEDSTGF